MTTDLHLGEHISNRFNEELEAIRNQVAEMGGLVESQVNNALLALFESDSAIAEMVSSSDDKVNTMEMSIDEQCAQILVRRQPAASDLRLVFSVIKTTTDLERIGDEAAKIARYAMTLADKDFNYVHFEQLRHLGEQVQSMLHDALDSFMRLDTELAVKTMAKDSRVDEEFEIVSRLLITHMMEDPREIKNALSVTWCARALERIGDHAVNLCEYVVYMVEGKDVRHTSYSDRK